MKRIRVLALVFVLLLLLAACGDKGTKKSSGGREAQALECMKNFAGAKTVEEMEKHTTEMSQEMKRQCEELLQQGSMPEVARVTFVESYEGTDVYSVVYLDPNTGGEMSYVGYAALVWQNGKYLVSTNMALQEKMAARYTDCECAAGRVYTAVDPCETCNGTGMAPGINVEPSVPGDVLQVNPDLEIVTPVVPEESLGAVDGSSLSITQLQPVEGELTLGSGQVAVIQPDGSVQMEDSVGWESVVISPGYVSGVIGEADLCPDCKGVTEYKAEDCSDCKGLGLLINR